ncbi:Penicillin-insensitive murein endopeptidase [Sulfitobacter noctilucae]|uniref:penicillin-insensitive murein endopeptidase n=1 Tax=Sulfitobacter noctilucae TaxID=1342302 RepID=UPI000469479C|nr:penicillin-insensitive murein endopeptidase [Sulfitobacter noctilucae]KIN75370.1 Penicillin-insensitive murein endopeptidase [Sulfitobacter noctilucae]
MILSRFLGCAALALALVSCGNGGGRDISGAREVLPTIGSSGGALSNVQAKKLFGAKSRATSQSSAAFGSYAKGCMAGGAQLPETGPTWQAMRLSRNRNWAHPETVDMVKKLSAFAATQPGWKGLYVGDLSQPRGGPMLTGHRSHQIGLDADIWMLPPKSLNLTRKQRENISSISMRRASGAYVNSSWTRSHHEIIKAAAKDPRTARIFVFPGAKVQMCADEKGDRSYLRKIRPWYGHHYHFHVRLNCPKGVRGCVNQNPPPAGDGCADARQWQANILNPPPPKPRDPNAKPKPPRRELVLADLPAQCKAVLDN